MLNAPGLLGVLVLLKVVDVLARGAVTAEPLWAAGALLLAGAGGALLGGHERPGWLLLVAGAVLTCFDAPVELRRQHLVLLALVALAALLARTSGERRLLWSVQLSALYGVAALAKLNEPYLSGTVLAAAVQDAPFGAGLLGVPPLAVLLVASCGLVLTETLLALTPWLRRLHGPGLAVAVLFHAAAVPLAGYEPLVALRLTVFGGTSLVLLMAVTGRLDGRTTSSRKADRNGSLSTR